MVVVDKLFRCSLLCNAEWGEGLIMSDVDMNAVF